MNRFRTATLILSLFALGGCAQGGSESDSSMSGPSRARSQSSVLTKLRPKANPNKVRAVHEQEERERQEQIKRAQEAMAAQQEASNKNLFQTTMDGVGSLLPKVSTEPISAPPAESIASGMPSLNPFAVSQPAEAAQPVPTNNGGIDSTSLTPADDVMPVSGNAGMPNNQQVATYSLHYSPAGIATPPPGAINGGSMVPPPPAVTLSTDARVGYPPPPPNAMPYNPYGYANPYQNPYMNPYQVPYQPPTQPVQPPPEPKRPKGLFGSGKSSKPKTEVEVPEKKVEDHSDFVPIRPTGMSARSPYKQRDDLKILWNGALGSYSFHEVLAQDDKLESILRRVSVGMPPDSSRGMFTVPQRRVQTVFRPLKLNKKVSGKVRKLQHDLVQSYYRYLYTYNKYLLAQQTVAARKQEIEVARTRAEKQRAHADLAKSENEAESTKEDMRAAQYELAAVAGARASRSLIGRISGITPSVGALAQAEKSTQPVEIDPGKGANKGVFGSVGSWFKGPGGGVSKKKAPKPKPKKVAKKSNSGGGFFFGRKSKDLSPKPSSKATKIASRAPMPAAHAKAKKLVSPISFELKNVDITARKSILSVAIRNTGTKNFKVTPEDISISDGTRKISSETLRAKFDSNLVRPNQEVKGKITIYGRPWNDRLAVFLSDGSSNVQLKRRNN